MKKAELLKLALNPKNWRMLFTTYKEICMYIIFGIATTVVSFLSYYLFRLAFPTAESAPPFLRFIYTFASRAGVESNTALPVLLSWVLAVAFAYVTNRIWVFEARAHGFFPVLREIMMFVGGRILTLLVDVVLMFLLVDLGGFYNALYELFAKLFSAVVVTILNYFISKFLVFRKP